MPQSSTRLRNGWDCEDCRIDSYLRGDLLWVAHAREGFYSEPSLPV